MEERASCPGLDADLYEPIDVVEIEDELDGEREAEDAWRQIRHSMTADLDDEGLTPVGKVTMESVLEAASTTVTDNTERHYRRYVSISCIRSIVLIPIQVL